MFSCSTIACQKVGELGTELLTSLFLDQNSFDIYMLLLGSFIRKHNKTTKKFYTLNTETDVSEVIPIRSANDKLDNLFKV